MCLFFFSLAIAKERISFNELAQEIEFGSLQDVDEYLDSHTVVTPTPQEAAALLQAIVVIPDADAQIIAEHLQKQGIEVIFLRDSFDNTLLHYATKAGHSKLIMWLVEEMGADVMAQNKNKERPLDKLSVKDVLLREILFAGPKKIQIAAMRGNSDAVRDMLRTDPSQKNVVDALGRTLLYYASPDSKLFGELLKIGINSNQGDSEKTLLQLLTKNLFLLRNQIGIDGDPVNSERYQELKKTIEILLNQPAIAVVEKNPNDPASRHPVYFAALTDTDIFKKLLVREPAFVFLKTPNKQSKNTFLGALVTEYASRVREYSENTPYLVMLRTNIAELLAHGASRDDIQYSVPIEKKTIAEYIMLIKDLVPLLYEIFFPLSLHDAFSQFALSVYTLSQSV